MNSRCALAALALFAVLPGCSRPPDVPGCLDEEPAHLDDACVADGECGNWLVCNATCQLPPAVSGEGGSVLRVTDAEGVVELNVEIARSDLARSRGLGNRPCMVDGWGLLIEFPAAGDHLITVEQMRFDLDIAMVDEEGRIVTVYPDVSAGSDTLYGADVPISAVLEAPAGAVDLRQGAQLEYE